MRFFGKLHFACDESIERVVFAHAYPCPCIVARAPLPYKDVAWVYKLSTELLDA